MNNYRQKGKWKTGYNLASKPHLNAIIEPVPRTDDEFASLYYLRERSGKAVRLKERFNSEAAATEAKAASAERKAAKAPRKPRPKPPPRPNPVDGTVLSQRSAIRHLR